LTEAGRITLDEVAATRDPLEFMAGELVGHTDSVGSDPYNQSLSERRAKAVVDYRKSKGVAARGRLTARGAVESKPVADDRTEQGHVQNRRVVFSRTDCEAPR